MNSTPLPLRATIWLWLIAALFAGSAGWLARLPAPAAVAGVPLGLAALLWIAYAKLAGLRTWIDSLDLRAFVLLHVARLVGIYFFVLHSRGVLPHDFAIPAGGGDILVALLGVLVTFLPLSESTRRRYIGLWNIVGLADLLLVLITSVRLGLQDPGQLRVLTMLPLSLLPTFLTPLLLFTHIVILIRLRREEAPAT
ncbi:MAG TPA: hypothetical protein VFJ90_09040 [Candidatus Didemnitutus sp.]|nr:hypothetical protein [Candidatus Didemnitutus sp.]